MYVKIVSYGQISQEDTMRLGEKVALLLRERSITKLELSHKMGLKDSSVISHWTHNRFSPNHINRQKLATIFAKPTSYFEDDSISPISDIQSYIPRATHVGVIGTISAERFNMDFRNPPVEYLPILVESSRGKRNLALRVNGSFLEPTARDGDYIVVTQTHSVNDGQLAIIRLADIYTIQRVYHKKNYFELRLDNQTCKMSKIKTPELYIVGQVTVVVKKP